MWRTLQVMELCEQLGCAVSELLDTAPETSVTATPATADELPGAAGAGASADALQIWFAEAATTADLRLLRSKALRLRLAVAGQMAPETLAGMAVEVHIGASSMSDMKIPKISQTLLS